MNTQPVKRISMNVVMNGKPQVIFFSETQYNGLLEALRKPRKSFWRKFLDFLLDFFSKPGIVIDMNDKGISPT